MVTVNKDEHERILLEHLNAWFVTSAPSGDVLYDYGDGEPGPLQLSIPIGLDPQAAPLQGQEPSAQVSIITSHAVDNLTNLLKIVFVYYLDKKVRTTKKSLIIEQYK